MSKVADITEQRQPKAPGRYFTSAGWTHVFTAEQFMDAVDKHFTEDDTRSRLVASIILDELRKGSE